MANLEFSYRDSSFIHDPYSELARMRRESPVYRHTDAKLWSVFRYQDIHALLRDFESFSSIIDDGLPSEQAGRDIGRNSTMSAIDPPDHTRLRSLISPAFSPRMLKQLAGSIRRTVIRLIDDAVAQRSVDFTAAFSFELPMIVITEMLGLPHDDSARLRRWSDDLAQSQFVGVGGKDIPADLLARRQQVGVELRPYLTPAVQERWAAPRDDLISMLLGAREEGKVHDLIELISTVNLLLFAGNQTTQHLLSNAVVLLAERPQLQQQLREEPALIPAAVEEVLRFEAPVTVRLRRATRDMKLNGVPIPKDATVLWWISSANRDETVFPHPDVFDITRQPNRHLSFGFGPHFCVGANLGRLEACIALEELLARTASFRLLGEGPWIRTEPFGFRGVAKLPVELLACDHP